jgi:hypothetical protein
MTDLTPYIAHASDWEKALWEVGELSGRWGWIYNTTAKLYGRFILTPLARLYLWGPNIGGWGFWEGLEMHDICAQQTHYSSEFWKQHPYACAEIVTKKFYSLLIVIQTLVYFIVLYCIVKFIYRLVCRCRSD